MLLRVQWRFSFLKASKHPAPLSSSQTQGPRCKPPSRAIIQSINKIIIENDPARYNGPAHVNILHVLSTYNQRQPYWRS
ncbi:hypothetical protein TNCV_3192391 [Trichonephila clavipes]|nr:hypothetical protein TNCV_3192391 [Trichonephila clavipes]